MKCSLVLIPGLLLSSVVAFAQGPAGGPGGPPPKPKGIPADMLIKILSAPEVQEEIGLDEDQLRNIRQRSMEVQQELETLLRQRIATVLEDSLSKEQYGRLKQISYRVLGAGALQDSDLVKQLSLTSKQQADIKRVYESMAIELEDAKHALKGREGEELRLIVEDEVRRSTQDRIMSMLDSGQRRRYEQMLGKDFDASMIHLGGGPPPRGAPKGPPQNR